MSCLNQAAHLRNMVERQSRLRKAREPIAEEFEEEEDEEDEAEDDKNAGSKIIEEEEEEDNNTESKITEKPNVNVLFIYLLAVYF